MSFSKISIFSIILASLLQFACGGHTDENANYDENNIICRLWEKSFTHGAMTNSNRWECSFGDQGTSPNVGGFSKKAIVGLNNEMLNGYFETNHAKSGTTMMVLSEAKVLSDRIIIDTEKVIAIEDYHLNSIDRRLADSMGTLETVVVRVNIPDSSPPEAEVLSNDIFYDEYSLKHQFGNCSFGKLQINEYNPGENAEVPTAAPGVIDIDLDSIVVEAGDNTVEYFQDIVVDAFLEMFDVEEDNLGFDIVMFCMPPGLADWDSYSYINGWQSFTNNEDCLYLSHQMQQVGHNLGLDHSGEYSEDESEAEYGDQTGYMGLSVDIDDGPAMCFNPAKSWQLGWYEDKTIEIDVTSQLSNDPLSPLKFKLNGVVDYDDTSDFSFIVVKVGNFYIGFNRATEFNSGVPEGANQVTVVERLGEIGSPNLKSKLVSKLSVGDSYTMAINGVALIDLKYESNIDGKDAIMEIKYTNEAVTCEEESATDVGVTISTDRWYGEIGWAIVDANGRYVYLAEIGSIDEAGVSTTPVQGLCRDVEYSFVILDSWGDGFCCEYASGDDGTFSIATEGGEGEVVLEGTGEFTTDAKYEVKTFVIPSPEEEEEECEDFPNKKFDITIGENTKTNKNCAWLAEKGKKKRKQYCKTKVTVNGKNKRLHKICKETCGLVGKGECAYLKDGQ